MGNEGKTREQIVAERIARGKEARAHNKVHMLELVDRLIEFLQVNRESIGGVSVCILADHDHALYDPQDNDASEGLSLQTAVSSTIQKTMNHTLQEIIDGVGDKGPEQHGVETFFQQLLGGASATVIGGGGKSH